MTRSNPGLASWRVALLGIAMLGISLSPASFAQNESGGTDAGSCVLRDHVYSCNGAAFQPMLANAKTVAVDVHNADGVARAQLTALLTKKLGKQVVRDEEHPELIFLLIPIEPAGIAYGGGDIDLGTLRVYSVTADGARGHLLWAETYVGAADLPWPAVVRGLLAQFQGHFRIR